MEQTKKPKTKAIITGGIIAILIVLVVILLVILMNSNGDIILTKENVKDYFRIYFDNERPREELNIIVDAISNNFTYEEVEFEIEFNGKITTNISETQEFKETPIKIKCNIRGYGSTTIAKSNRSIKVNEASYTITSVKGKVKPVGK